jgi:hypothetical protein
VFSSPVTVVPYEAKGNKRIMLSIFLQKETASVTLLHCYEDLISEIFCYA